MGFGQLSCRRQPILYLYLLLVEVGDGLRLSHWESLPSLVLECQRVGLLIRYGVDYSLPLVELFVGFVVSTLAPCHRVQSGGVQMVFKIGFFLLSEYLTLFGPMLHLVFFSANMVGRLLWDVEVYIVEDLIADSRRVHYFIAERFIVVS